MNKCLCRTLLGASILLVVNTGHAHGYAGTVQPAGTQSSKKLVQQASTHRTYSANRESVQSESIMVTSRHHERVQTAPTPLESASIPELHQRLTNGPTSVGSLTQHFLNRIADLDQSGPRVNSVIEINPDAMEIARALDLSPGKRGGRQSLFGIPILLKDNIDTGDQMQTSAGSLALTGTPAARDAPLVVKLRKAGAVILGKTNMSEWANFRSIDSTHGWSGRGGLTRNPHVLDRSACGSSSGSAAAVAAGFATVAIATETDMSIVCPSSANGVVGIKPSLGLVSRTGIVPISHNQDTAGPIARSVADAAAVLTVIAGSDPQDPYTKDADQHATNYTRFLDPGALAGKRIGVVRALAGRPDLRVDRILTDTISVLRAHGTTVIDPVVIPHVNDYGDAELTVLFYDLKHDLNAYLATRDGMPVRDLGELILFNKAHAAKEMPWFGQDAFIEAEIKGPLTDETYRTALARAKRLSGPEGIDAVMKKYKLDALLTPTTGPARTIDLVNGDHISVPSSSPAAVAGYPSISVPAGFIHCLPVGMSFFAGKWSEPTLIGIAYAFEQATHVYRSPQFLPTVADCEQSSSSTY
ncbi:MAG: amidase [Rhodanobacter sp.]